MVDDLDLVKLQANPALVTAGEGRLELGGRDDLLDLLFGLLGRGGASKEVVPSTGEGDSGGAVEQGVVALLGLGGRRLGGIAADLESLRRRSITAT